MSRVARRALTDMYLDAYSRVQAVVSRWTDVEQAVESALHAPTLHAEVLMRHGDTFR